MTENAGSKPVTVACSGHHEMLADGLWKFFQAKHRTDWMHFCGTPISAHRLVVEVFLSPDKLTECYGSQKSEDDINWLLEFLYTGTVTVRQDQLERLKTVAQELELTILSDALANANAAPKTKVRPLAKGGRETVGFGRSTVKGCGVTSNLVDSVREDLFPAMSDGVGWPATYHQEGSPAASAAEEQVEEEEVLDTANRGPPVFVEFNSEYLVVGDGGPRVDVDYEAPGQPWRLQVDTEGRSAPRDAFGWDDGGTVLSSTAPPDATAGEAEEPPLADQNVFDEEPNIQYVFIVPKMEAAAAGTDSESDVAVALTSQYDAQYADGANEYPSSSAQWDVQVEEVTLETAEDSISVAVAKTKRRPASERKRKRSLECEVCGKTFADRSKLDRHVTRSHRPEPKRGYKCGVCGETFKRRQRLADHVLVHADADKPFACGICGKRFKLIHHLRRHDVTHAASRNAVAHDSASSKRLKQFKKRALTPVYRCDECGKSLSDSSTLRRHRLTHTSQDKPFACPAAPCSYRCNRRDNLRAHMRNVHKLDPDQLTL